MVIVIRNFTKQLNWSLILYILADKCWNLSRVSI